ncbi:MAG TPA: hypothetical protein VJ824_07290 [Bacillota bacterium]|nr:hypothetical protein [Bacillota bacterium]
MRQQIPLYYLQWDEMKGVMGQINEDFVDIDDLFLRKLVNATMIHNQIWEHSSHETNEDLEGIIYVKPWAPGKVEHGKEMEKIVFSQFERSNPIGVEFFALDGQHYSKISSVNYDQSLYAAQILLDHYRYIQGKYYTLNYAIWDSSRSKLLIFLEAGE